MSAITLRAVLRAVHDLRDDGRRGVTAAEIARYLDTDANKVLEQLVDLKARRILSDKTRDGKRTWQRWGG